MKIILDESKKDGVLIKNDGTEISRYSYKNIINDSFTLEMFKRDIEGFNRTLAMQEEFDNIRDMAKYVTIHNFDQ